MEISDCLQSKIYFVVLILAIFKAIIIYSVGRSHNSYQFEIQLPSVKEWLMIVVLITVLYIVGSIFLAVSVGNQLERKMQNMQRSMPMKMPVNMQGMQGNMAMQGMQGGMY